MQNTVGHNRHYLQATLQMATMRCQTYSGITR